MEELFRGMVVSELPSCLQPIDCCNCGRKKKQSSINCSRHTFVRPGITSLNPLSN